MIDLFKVDNKKILLIRGDTGTVNINFSEEVETAVFSVKRNITDVEYILQKDITEGVLNFEHSDTNDLQPGKYVFDIQVSYDGIVDTPLIGTLEIIADVTRE